jgi:hypothetical protein
MKKNDKRILNNGAEYFRNLVKFLNSRKETLNENKTPLTLMYEYNKTIRNEKT